MKDWPIAGMNYTMLRAALRVGNYTCVTFYLLKKLFLISIFKAAYLYAILGIPVVIRGLQVEKPCLRLSSVMSCWVAVRK